jgi:hypothetical protein
MARKKSGKADTEEVVEGVTLEVISIDDIEPDPANPNKGTPRGKAMTDFSVDTFKPARGVALDKGNVTLAGNKTVESAKRAGVKRVVVVETDGDVLVATRRRDMNLSDPDDHRAREYTVADNRTAEVGIRYDEEMMAAAVEDGADMSVLFYDDELEKLIGDGPIYFEEDDGYDDSADLVPEMELQPFEHYDYVMLMFRSQLDWSRAIEVLGEYGLVKSGFTISRKSRKIGLCRVIDGAKLMDALVKPK